MRKIPLVLLMCGVSIGAGILRQPRADTTGAQPPLTASHDEAAGWADRTLKTLSLERKVAQLVCEQMRGEYVPEDSTQFQYWLRLVREYGVGGFVLYGGTPHDTARLLNRLQRESALPLLIAADFEGGPGQQIAGATEFPANMALSAIGSAQIAYEVGKVGAIEGRAIGIHLTYSPVVDIQTQPQNPVLSVRSFGRDVELLGRMAGAYIRGYQENGMLATAKHYPGRGDVELIAGTEFTVNKKPAAQVEREDLLAFKKAIEAGVAFIMSEHIAVPSLTNGSDLPASVEPLLATTWLREKLGFQGALTSDDLWYAKMTARFGAERSAVLALKAGHDALLKPADAIRTLAAVVEAVKAGEIGQAQIDRSVHRLLYWKARLNLHRNRFVDESRVSAVVGVKPHRDLVQTIAERSLTLLVNRGFLPANSSRVGKILHVILQKNDADPAALAAASKIREAFPVLQTIAIGPTTDPGLRDQARRAAGEADTVVVSVFNQRTVYKDNGPLRDADLTLIRDLTGIRAGATIVMSYGNPYLAESLHQAAAFVVGYGEGGFYGNQVAYADAFIRLLRGEITPQGRLPVHVSARFPMGSGLRP